ncbi:putative mating-type switching protein swi10 [Rosellinia necatrix]|uniref:Putative mating-type switching protein swi10 n=1 Tax=Rosellinia necatrix TaxID=77044 RepID=A0A1W2TFE2_ROSNE|nr:putative mating-type switching protein swi10 [Rosellinia necatrix]
MDRYLSQLWAAAPSMVKPEAKKLKRKLQKVGAQQRPYSVNYSDIKMNPECKPQKTSSPFHLFSSAKPSAPQRSTLPPPTQPDDGQWLEDFRKSGYLCRGDRRSRLCENENLDRRASVVPEFAHLAVANGPSIAPQEKSASPSIKSGQPQTMRRYAKTPVLHIGQLETHPLLRTQGTSQDVPSIESIAESYRALLESRSSLLTEPTIERSTTPGKHGEPFTPQDPSLVPPPLEPVAELPETPLARGSPRSDDGTLVEEDAVDFKNAHFSSTPSTPSWASYETASPRLERRVAVSSRTPDLQTCLNLLTKELSTAINRSSIQLNANTSALQIWCMIEAYSKLRDQLLTTHGTNVQNSSLKILFDTWLKALHSVHDEMTGGDGQRSESDYGD